MNTRALDIAPFPIEIELWDGMIFYMTPLGHEELGYPESGLHRNGELIYAFEEWFLEDTLYFADDGMSFLTLPSGMGYIRFYEQGVLRHWRGVQPLLRDAERIRREHEPTDFDFIGPPWRIWDETYHDHVNNRLYITTVEGSRITFDLSTGLILSRYDPPEYVPSEQSPSEYAPPEQLTQNITAVAAVVIFSLPVIVIAYAVLRKKFSRS